MEKVIQRVSMEAMKHGKIQVPKIEYYGKAGKNDKSAPIFNGMTDVLFIVPRYSDSLAIPGTISNALDYLKQASNIFSSTCKITFLVDFSGRKLPKYIREGITVEEPTQKRARELIEKVLTEGKSVGIFTFAHGVCSGDDEKIFFPPEKDKKDKGADISGKWLAQKIAEGKASSVLLVQDICFADGVPDLHEVVEANAALELCKVKPTQAVTAFKSRVTPQSTNLKVTVENEGCDDDWSNITFTNIGGIPVSVGLSKSNHGGTVCRIESHDQYETLSHAPSAPPRLPYNPEAAKGLIEEISHEEISALNEEKGESTSGVSTTDADIQARDVNNVLNGVRPFCVALFESAQAGFSVLWLLMTGSGYSMFGAPLAVLLSFMAVSACAGIWFYLSFIGTHYVQTITPVAMTVLFSILLPLACDPETFRAWLPLESAFAFSFTTLLASLVTLLFTVSFNWNEIQRARRASIFFKESGPVLCTLVKISAIAVQLHFHGGAEKFHHTTVIRNNGVDSYVAYFPFLKNKNGEPYCAIPRKNSHYVYKLPKETGFSKFNETHDITCVFKVFQNRVKERTQGDINRIIKWVFDKGSYVLQNEDRRNTAFFRMLLDKNDLTALQDFQEENLLKASKVIMAKNSRQSPEIDIPWREDSSLLGKLSFPFLKCMQIGWTAFSGIMWSPTTVISWLTSPSRT